MVVVRAHSRDLYNRMAFEAFASALIVVDYKVPISLVSFRSTQTVSVQSLALEAQMLVAYRVWRL